MKCYVFITDRGLWGNIYTPADSSYSYRVTKYLAEKHGLYKSIKLKPYTTLNKIQLIPAILAAKMARLVRKIRNRKCTDLENKLMRYYYEEEVRVRGYV